MARLGFVAVTGAAVLWAAGATVAGRMFERGASPIELTAARAWLSWIGMAVLLLAMRSRARRPRGRTHPGMVIAFGLTLAAANATYYLAISRLPVAIAIVIQYTSPGLVVLWTAAAARRRPSRRIVGALALAFAGVALLAELPRLLTEGGLRLDGLGLLAAAGSSLAFAAYMLTGEALGPRLGTARSLTYGFAVASVAWVVVLAFRGRPDTLLDSSFTAPILFVSIGATLAPFLLFLWGLGRVGATRAGIASTLEPLMAAVFAFVWLDQSLSLLQVGGAAMVLAGITVVQTERPAQVEVAAIEVEDA